MFQDSEIVAFKIQIRNEKLTNFDETDLDNLIVAQTEPEKGSLFSRMQNQSEVMQNGLAKSTISTSSNMGKRLLTKFTDKARRIKSSGLEIKL